MKKPRVLRTGQRVPPLSLPFGFLCMMGLLLLLPACRFSFEGPPIVQQIALADFTGNGTLDAYLTINPRGEPYIHPDYVLFNDGTGRGQSIGNTNSFTVTAGDVDGDGAIDVVAGNRLYRNGGRGTFSLGNQRLDDGATRFVFVFLVDLTANGHLDLFIGEEAEGRVWLNDGRGHFSQVDQRVSYDRTEGVALGDVTGDGLPDVLVAGVEAYQIWRGEGDGQFTAGPRTDYR